MSGHGWTAADAAELDALVYELARGYAEHRERCGACRPDPCPQLESWLEHKDGCRACHGDAPLSHPPSDDCRARHRTFVEHGRTCRRCNPCPRLREAIAVVLDWRDARSLRSRAQALRADLDTHASIGGAA